MGKQIFKFALIFVFYLFVVPGKANAYLDPGSGSFIFQLLLGTLFGMLFAIKIYWGKIKDFFVRLFDKNPKKKEKK